jgi:hypothetical protein
MQLNLYAAYLPLDLIGLGSTAISLPLFSTRDAPSIMKKPIFAPISTNVCPSRNTSDNPSSLVIHQAIHIVYF